MDGNFEFIKIDEVKIVKKSVDWNIKRNMYQDIKNEHWDFCPPILIDESLLSWFARLAKENCSDVRLLYQKLIKPQSICHLNLQSLGNELIKIEINSTIRTEIIDALKPYITLNISELEKNTTNQKISKDQWNFLNTPLESPRYCPLCLANDKIPYFRTQWFAKTHFLCPIHKNLLLDVCPFCSQPIEFWNTEWNEPLFNCHHCHKSLINEAIGLLYVKDLSYLNLISNKSNQFTFLRQLWMIIFNEHYNTLLKENWNMNQKISIERLYRMLLTGLKIISEEPDRLKYPFVCKEDNLKFADFAIFQLHEKDHLLLSKNQNEHLVKRLKILNPLISIGSPTIREIQDYSYQVGYYWQTIWRWWKDYLEKGIDGLEPKFNQRGRKRKSIPVIEKEYNHLIRDYIQSEHQKPMRELYRDIQWRMRTLGISEKPLSYASMRRDIILKRSQFILNRE
jgi:hypothetical protein